MTIASTSPDFVYKIVSRAAFEGARKNAMFPVMPIDLKDGYVHLSTAAQLAETLNLHFAGQGNLVVFAVRCADLGEGLRWEPSRGGALFPHAYGTIASGLVGQSAPVTVPAAGGVTLPDWIR